MAGAAVRENAGAAEQQGGAGPSGGGVEFSAIASWPPTDRGQAQSRSCAVGWTFRCTMWLR